MVEHAFRQKQTAHTLDSDKVDYNLLKRRISVEVRLYTPKTTALDDEASSFPATWTRQREANKTAINERYPTPKTCEANVRVAPPINPNGGVLNNPDAKG